MKHFFLLFILISAAIWDTSAQAPQFPEPEYVGQVLVVLPDDTTAPLIQESMTPRHRSTTSAVLFGIGKTKDEMTLKGPRAMVRLKPNDGIAFIIRSFDNNIDPMSEINIFRFEVNKKRRQAEYASVGVLGDKQTNTLDRLPFTARKFGNSSYLVILKDTQPGEYGITINSIPNLTVSTFGIDE